MTEKSEAGLRDVKRILESLISSATEIQASAVLTRDGYILVTALGENVNQVRIGAICATLLSLGEKASKEINLGTLSQILVQTEQGCLLLTQVGQKGVLALVSKATANLGMVFVKAKRAAQEIAGIGIV